MATGEVARAGTAARAPGLGEIESHSIDWVPAGERHGKLWHQGPLWFLGNFQYFSVPIGFIGPGLGLSLGWTVVAGFLGLVRVFRAILVVSLPLMIIVTVGIVFGLAHGTAPAHHLGFHLVGFMAEFSAAAAYNITYAPYVSDYSRYLPASTRRRAIVASVFAGAAGAAFWLIAVGAFLAIRLGATDGLLGIRTAGNDIVHPLGALSAFFLAAGLAATMGMNAYGGMLSLLTAIDSIRSITPTRAWRVVTIIALTVVWCVIGRPVTGNAVNTVLTSLTLMLYLLVPWTATNLVDYFFVRRGHYAIGDLFTPRGIYGRWGRNGLIAYAVGFAVEI